MIKNIVLLLLVLITGYCATAQENLILNPSFEDMNWCWAPSSGGLLWNKKLCTTYPYASNVRDFSPTLSEYSNNTWSMACDSSFVSISMFDKVQNLWAGCNFLGKISIYLNYGSYLFKSKDKNANLKMYLVESIYANNHGTRTFMQGKIKTPLRKDCRYNFKCYLRADTFINKPSPEGPKIYSTNSFGIAFLNTPVYYKNYKELILNHQPDIENPSSRWLNDSIDYLPVVGEYIAKGGEQYLLLGNFKSLDQTPYKPELIKNISSEFPEYWPLQLEYFLDDLSLTAVVPESLKLDLGNDTLTCGKDQPLKLEAQSGFASYKWNTGDTGRTLYISKPGTYIVKADFGCGIINDTVVVKPFNRKKNQLQVGETLFKCPDEIVSLKASMGYLNYSWSNGEKSSVLNTKEAGTYEVSALSMEGCNVKDTVEIKNIKNILPVNLGQDTTICLSKEISFNLNIDNESVLWSNGSQDKNISISNPGSYSVKVYNKCFQVSDTIFIKTKDCSSVFIPNVFTPNGDGVNDSFNIVTPDQRSMGIKIYSRWGNLIFSDDKYSGAWLAENLSDGIYFYIISDTEYKKEYKGQIQIIR